MTDLDYTSLDRILPPATSSPDWGDVMSRFRVEHGRRRRRFVVAVTAIALVAVVSASALAVRAFFIDKGFIGLPPVGATASTPKRGDLVLSAYGVTGRSRNKVWVYRDGRVIWQREYPPGRRERPESANAHSSGLLEQRLTPRGVELLRSEILSTGLFGRDRELSMARPVPFFNYIHVRNGGRLVRVTWHQHPPYRRLADSPYPLATREQATALQRLIARVTEPESWLPASAWRDQQVRAYVPARFELWYGAWPLDVRFSDILKPLPVSARELLRTKRPRRVAGRVGSPTNLVPAYAYVFRVTTEEARSLRRALVAAGLDVDWRIDDVALAYRAEVRHPNAGAITITFVPILPHGGPAAPGG